VVGVGDPGDEHVVRMVDEVVPREGVDELAIAAVVRGGDGHDLTLARGRCKPFGSEQEAVSVRREQRRGYEDQRIVAGLRRVDDRGYRRVVAGHETSEQWVHARDIRGLR